MPLRFLLDAHLRGPLWHAIQRHNMQGGLPLDVVRVGDQPDLPLGSDDPEILLWAERENRIMVTEDRNTMAGHLNQHLKAGHHSPGVLVIVAGRRLSHLMDHLQLIAHAGMAADFENCMNFIP